MTILAGMGIVIVGCCFVPHERKPIDTIPAARFPAVTAVLLLLVVIIIITGIIIMLRPFRLDPRPVQIQTAPWCRVVRRQKVVEVGGGLQHKKAALEYRHLGAALVEKARQWGLTGKRERRFVGADGYGCGGSSW